jgi:hypothetical protein
MIKNKEIVTGIQEYERTLDATAKMEVVREGTLEQARFQMAVVFDPIIQYQMMKSQNYQGVGWTRFQRPQKADLILEKNPAAFKELLNLVLQGTNTNNYLNTRLNKLKKIGQKLDSAIVKEYGDKFH